MHTEIKFLSMLHVNNCLEDFP